MEENDVIVSIKHAHDVICSSKDKYASLFSICLSVVPSAKRVVKIQTYFLNFTCVRLVYSKSKRVSTCANIVTFHCFLFVFVEGVYYYFICLAFLILLIKLTLNICEKQPLVYCFCDKKKKSDWINNAKYVENQNIRIS